MVKIRTIQQGMYQIAPVKVGPTVDLRAWLTLQAQTHRLTTLLAHADDGVIWGRLHEGRLLTADEVFPQQNFPALRWLTLQQARLFSLEAELLLWQSDAGWQARLVQEGAGQPVEFYDEWQMLWGAQLLDQAQGFALVRDGAQGLYHAPPVCVEQETFAGKNQRPLRLQVRHYLNVAPDGLLKVSLSRLVGLTTK